MFLGISESQKKITQTNSLIYTPPSIDSFDVYWDSSGMVDDGTGKLSKWISSDGSNSTFNPINNRAIIKDSPDIAEKKYIEFNTQVTDCGYVLNQAFYSNSGLMVYTVIQALSNIDVNKGRMLFEMGGVDTTGPSSSWRYENIGLFANQQRLGGYTNDRVSRNTQGYGTGGSFSTSSFGAGENWFFLALYINLSVRAGILGSASKSITLNSINSNNLYPPQTFLAAYHTNGSVITTDPNLYQGRLAFLGITRTYHSRSESNEIRATLENYFGRSFS